MTNMQHQNRSVGRPAKQNWQALRPEIAALVEQGHGYGRLAARYKMTVPGIKAVLKRLSLVTHGSQQYRQEA